MAKSIQNFYFFPFEQFVGKNLIGIGCYLANLCCKLVVPHTALGDARYVIDFRSTSVRGGIASCFPAMNMHRPLALEFAWIAVWKCVLVHEGGKFVFVISKQWVPVCVVEDIAILGVCQSS